MSEEARRKVKKLERLQESPGSGGDPDAPEPDPGRSSKTAGTNRDFDESGRSANQGHGHPREERSRASEV